MTALIEQSLQDPFRLILLAGLFLTMLRTRAQTGVLLPLAIGAVFVAVLIATGMQASAPEPLMQRLIAGVIANALLLAAALGVWRVIERSRGN